MSIATKFTVGRVALNASTPVLIVAARPGRHKLLINLPASSLLVGPDSSLSASTGFSLPRPDQGPAVLETQDAVYGLSESSAITVSFADLHD